MPSAEGQTCQQLSHACRAREGAHHCCVTASVAHDRHTAHTNPARRSTTPHTPHHHQNQQSWAACRTRAGWGRRAAWTHQLLPVARPSAAQAGGGKSCQRACGRCAAPRRRLTSVTRKMPCTHGPAHLLPSGRCCARQKAASGGENAHLRRPGLLRTAVTASSKSRQALTAPLVRGHVYAPCRPQRACLRRSACPETYTLRRVKRLEWLTPASGLPHGVCHAVLPLPLSVAAPPVAAAAPAAAASTASPVGASSGGHSCGRRTTARSKCRRLCHAAARITNVSSAQCCSGVAWCHQRGIHVVCAPIRSAIVQSAP